VRLDVFDQKGTKMNDESAHKGPFKGYGGEDRPLGAYLALIGLFHLIFALFLLATKGSNRSLPQRVRLGDIILLGVATHKLGYLLSNEAVTSAIRAPFTEYQEMQSPSNVEEQPRGTGLRKAVGELLVCVFCIGHWIAAFLAYGLVLAPALTRFVAAIFAMVTVSDYLTQAYMAVMKKAQ
jgi:uncharacterized protein DUF1360